MTVTPEREPSTTADSPDHAALPATEETPELRRTTWLEHFSDLTYVIAIGTLIYRLAEHYTLAGTVQTAFLFLVIWWAWVGHTVYDTRFDPDDLIQRIATFVMMLGAAGLAIHVPTAFEEGGQAFALSYILVRLILVGLYARAAVDNPDHRRLAAWYAAGFGSGVLFWIVSLIVPNGWWLWVAGIGFELVFTRFIRTRIGRIPVDRVHLPERFGHFTIVTIGAAIISVCTAVSWTNLEPSSIAAALIGFVVTVAFWFVYFALIDADLLRKAIGSGQPFIYLHYPVLLGLIGFAAGIEHAIPGSDEESISTMTRQLIGVGNGLWIAALLAIRRFTIPDSIDGACLARYGCALLACMLFVFAGSWLTPVVALALLASALLVFAALDVRAWKLPAGTP